MGIKPFAAMLLLQISLPLLAAESTSPLPDPLTLEQALALADAQHPDVAQAEADRDMARANLAASEAQNGLNIWAEGRLRWVKPPSYAADQGHDDNKIGLYARKNLYDFGRTSARERSAEAELNSRDLRYQDVHSQRRVEIMRRYFDVLLADMQFAHDDEAMAVSYVNLDKLRQRHELGQVSDIGLAEQEAAYQRVRRERMASELRQRSAREQLAIVLNYPGQPPADLETPQLDDLPKTIPDYDQLLSKALHNNPLLLSLQAQVKADEAHVDAVRATGNPTLYGEAEAASYSRELATNDPLRIGVVLQVPLYSSGAVDAAVGQGQARLYKSRAQLQAAENEIRQTVLQLWQALGLLRIQEEEAKAQLDYRELYLDRSRANYEMEVSTDLGDAMVRLSEAQLAQAQARFQLALTWERLRGITGDMGESHDTSISRTNRATAGADSEK